LTVGYSSVIASKLFGTRDQIFFLVKTITFCWVLLTLSDERWVCPLSLYFYFSPLHIRKI